MGREFRVASRGRSGLVLVAGIGLAAALGGCATADAGGAHHSEASAPSNAPAPTTAAAPQAPATTAPATSPTPAVPAASKPPAAYRPPGAPPPVGPNDPKVDETLGGLDSKTPSGCRKYVNAVCRRTDFPDAYRLQLCASYVAAINALVKQIRESGNASAIDTCDAMAQSSQPQ
jgi:hypothetical protein